MIPRYGLRRLAIIVGLLVAVGFLWYWLNREVQPIWQFACGGRAPALAISRDGKFLAIGASVTGPYITTPAGTRPSTAGLLQIWNLADRKMIASFNVRE